jgi:Protein of unknown function (DUF3551)
MRILLIAGVALVAVLLEARPVQAYEGPWCAVVSHGNSSVYEDCQYPSFEACRPNVLAGNRGFCNPNPRWVASYDPGAKPRARHRRQVQQ